MSSRIEVGPYVLDVMEEIAKERKRLEKRVASPEYDKRKHHWVWMEEWLAKTDEEHFDHNYKTDSYYAGYIDDKYCNVCGKKDRFFLAMDFSFCSEYGCGIQICSKCLDEMQKLYESEVSE